MLIILQKILSGNFYHWHPKESQDMHNIHMSPIISLSVFVVISWKYDYKQKPLPHWYEIYHFLSQHL